MEERFRFEDQDYSLDEVSAKAKQLFRKIDEIQSVIKELTAKEAIIKRAKNGYIEDLKHEIVYSKSGVDLGTLITDD